MPYSKREFLADLLRVKGEIKREEFRARILGGGIDAQSLLYEQLRRKGIPPLRAGTLEQFTDQLQENCWYIPAGLTWKELLTICGNAGIPMHPVNKMLLQIGEEIPTEEGVIKYDLAKMMLPEGRASRPFNLDYDGHREWAREQGANDLPTLEGTLLLMLIAWLTLDRIPFMGGWIRCRNLCGPEQSLGVSWYSDKGLGIHLHGPHNQRWRYGTIAWRWVARSVEPASGEWDPSVVREAERTILIKEIFDECVQAGAIPAD